MKLIRKIVTLVVALIVSSVTQAADTIPEIKPFSRELERITFIPKGQWIGGISVNYAQSNQDNYQFLIVENLNGDAYSFKVSPSVFYAFADNMAAGGKFSYQRTKAHLKSGSVKLDSETTYDSDNLYSITSTYMGMAVYRYYLSLGNSMRFGLFNEVQLEIGGGQSKISNGTGVDLTGTYERNFMVNVGLAPGFMMFLNDYSAIEVNVGLLGFGYHHTKAITDQVYVSHRNYGHANFKINLFSISFGVMFYI